MAEYDSKLDAFLAGHAGFSGKVLFAPGAEAGEWVVSAFIARGGTSEVYCARNRASGKPAALKVLYRTGARHKARFAREAEFLAANACEALPRFYAKGVAAGRPYIAMELLEPQEPPKGDAAVARYILAVAKAAAWLHHRGLVHRDIKPRNIMWRMDGAAGRPQPVLVDFGLIKEISTSPIPAGEQLSVVDGRAVGVGTPRYAAPEQFTGAEATPAMDIHALGRLAYECFAGDTPRAWERIIRRATSSIPSERYRTVEDFMLAVKRRHFLRNALAGICAAAAAAGVAAFWAAAGGVEKIKWAAMLENTATNVVSRIIHSRICETNDYFGQRIVRPVKTVYGTATNETAVAILRLRGATNVFERPLRVPAGRELWVIGPGALDAVFEDSPGAVLRLSGGAIVNRTRKGLKQAGIRYILYKNSTLDFPEIPRVEEDEKDFLAMSTLPFPGDDAVAWPGVDPAMAKVRYKMTEEDFAREMKIEKAIIKARLESEKRNSRKPADIDADWIVD